MLILAIDLGKTKSLACWYQTDDTRQEFRTVSTRPGDFHSLLSPRKTPPRNGVVFWTRAVSSNQTPLDRPAVIVRVMQWAERRLDAYQLFLIALAIHLVSEHLPGLGVEDFGVVAEALVASNIDGSFALRVNSTTAPDADRHQV
jgi:hypothetical protein